MKIVHKVTIAELGSKELAAKCVAENKSLLVGEIVGRVSGTKLSKVPNTDGEFTTKLTGEFYGRSVLGVEVQGSQSILPSIVHHAVVEALTQSDSGEVEFAIRVGIEPRPGRSIPYQYTVEPLMQPKASNSLMRLIALLPGDTAFAKQLNAAAKEPETTTTAPVEKIEEVVKPAAQPQARKR